MKTTDKFLYLLNNNSRILNARKGVLLLLTAPNCVCRTRLGAYTTPWISQMEKAGGPKAEQRGGMGTQGKMG